MVEAAIVIIGEEILSGSVLDVNTSYLCGELAKIGINVRHVRILPDEESEIIQHVNQLRSQYNYVFVTGGIGPTHDDITTLAIANLFKVSLLFNEEVAQTLCKNRADYPPERIEAILKMAYFPEKSRLIYNDATDAPGYVVENVYILAGLPNVMRSMFEAVKHELKGGAVVKSKTLFVPYGESLIAKRLEKVQLRYKTVNIGSYPFQEDGQWFTNLVLRSTDEAMLEQVYLELQETVINLV